MSQLSSHDSPVGVRSSASCNGCAVADHVELQETFGSSLAKKLGVKLARSGEDQSIQWIVWIGTIYWFKPLKFHT